MTHIATYLASLHLRPVLPSHPHDAGKVMTYITLDFNRLDKHMELTRGKYRMCTFSKTNTLFVYCNELIVHYKHHST